MSHADRFRRIVPAVLGKPTVESPLEAAFGPEDDSFRFVGDDVFIRDNTEVAADATADEELLFEKAGPRAKLFFDPAATRAAIVTCGGLCPGLNAVIRSLVLELHYNYGLAEILGIRYGYFGLNRARGPAPITLTPEFVSEIHHDGGTVLASSRGQQSVPDMVDTLAAWKIDILFCVGGDGTLRGAHAIQVEAQRRGLPIAIVGVPKTIDNDVLYCDRTFGFVTAVEKAADVMDCAHVEAQGAYRGVGLVKVMGRNSGFIAAVASLACQDVNFVLIPEVPFDLHGERGFLAALERRLDVKPHAVVVVAEGAGQELFINAPQERDASGNLKPQDIGTRLRQEISGHFKSIGKPVEMKYIDPSYLIRGAPANREDRLLCDQLARNAAHAAMAGRTDIVICQRSGRFIHVPIPLSVASTQRVNPRGSLWTNVISMTGQPARFG
jgi:6-phosphofructokinase 1